MKQADNFFIVSLKYLPLMFINLIYLISSIHTYVLHIEFGLDVTRTNRLSTFTQFSYRYI